MWSSLQHVNLISSCVQLLGNPWSRGFFWQRYTFVGFTGLDCLREEQGGKGESSSETCQAAVGWGAGLSSSDAGRGISAV